ncbi:MAG: NACHT domain-containing protein [Caldilineaceae bacterium]
MSHEPERNGDQIRIRDMIGNIAVAVGRGAQATANIFGDVNLFRDQEQARTERDRVNMLAMVHNFWIQGVLEKSLYDGALIQIAWRATNDAVDNAAWQSVMQLPADVTTASPVTATLAERFFSLNPLQRTLLLLGAPGSGKTTMLLVLAQQAIDRAQADPTEPIPVVFNLSTWSVKQPVLADWLVSEFSDKYYVAKSVSRPWIVQDRLLLLLDGLDEVPTECQAECIAAINAFRVERNIPIIVCCRTEEYAVLPVQLAFAAAVTLEPLTTEQIMAHLGASDDKGLLALRASAGARSCTPRICPLPLGASHHDGGISRHRPGPATNPHRRRHCAPSAFCPLCPAHVLPGQPPAPLPAGADSELAPVAGPPDEPARPGRLYHRTDAAQLAGKPAGALELYAAFPAGAQPHRRAGRRLCDWVGLCLLP